MVDFRTILQLVEFILCILYDGVALIVIPDCIEAIAFYAKIVTAVHIDVSEQIQGLKLVVVHICRANDKSASVPMCYGRRVTSRTEITCLKDAIRSQRTHTEYRSPIGANDIG